jgi:hypothetical protein
MEGARRPIGFGALVKFCLGFSCAYRLTFQDPL